MQTIEINTWCLTSSPCKKEWDTIHPTFIHFHQPPLQQSGSRRGGWSQSQLSLGEGGVTPSVTSSQGHIDTTSHSHCGHAQIRKKKCFFFQCLVILKHQLTKPECSLKWQVTSTWHLKSNGSISGTSYRVYFHQPEYYWINRSHSRGAGVAVRDNIHLCGSMLLMLHFCWVYKVYNFCCSFVCFPIP